MTNRSEEFARRYESALRAKALHRNRLLLVPGVTAIDVAVVECPDGSTSPRIEVHVDPEHLEVARSRIPSSVDDDGSPVAVEVVAGRLDRPQVAGEQPEEA